MRSAEVTGGYFYYMNALEHIKQKHTISGGHCGLYMPDLIKLTGKPYSELRNELNALYKDKKIKVRPGSRGNLIMLNKKKMKKLFTLAAVAAAMTITAQKSATATVTVILKDAMSISVEDATVVLTYETNEDYKNGVKVQKNNHLHAFSTSPYRITSSVQQDNLITQSDISLNGQLQTRDKKTVLYTDQPGAKVFPVEYSAKGNYEYLQKEKKSYVTQVIYTIEAI